MDDETLKFFAKYCFGESAPRDFSDWAIYCLEKGLDSKNLRILASTFDVQYTSEIEPYFVKSLDDLKLNYPIVETHLPIYANFIAKQIIEKEISAIEGCHEIYKVYRSLNYNSELINWCNLDSGLHPESYEELVFEKDGVENTELLEEAILEEAAKMVYGKKSTVLKVKNTELFDSLDNQQETFFSKLWKKIF